MSKTLFSSITPTSSPRQGSSKNRIFGLWSCLLALASITLPHTAHAVEQSDESVYSQIWDCAQNHDLDGVLHVCNLPIFQNPESMNGGGVEHSMCLRHACTMWAQTDAESAKKVLHTHAAKMMRDADLLHIATSGMQTQEQSARMMQLLKEVGLLDDKADLCQAFDFFINKNYQKCFEKMVGLAEKSPKFAKELKEFSLRSRAMIHDDMLTPYFQHFFQDRARDDIAIAGLLIDAVQYDRLRDCMRLTSGHEFWNDTGDSSLSYKKEIIERLKQKIHRQYNHNESEEMHCFNG